MRDLLAEAVATFEEILNQVQDDEPWGWVFGCVANIFSTDLLSFECQSCGHSMDAGKNAARNPHERISPHERSTLRGAVNSPHGSVESRKML